MEVKVFDRIEKKYLITNLLVLMALSQAHAENKTIDISGDNTDKTARRTLRPLPFSKAIPSTY